MIFNSRDWLPSRAFCSARKFAQHFGGQASERRVLPRVWLYWMALNLFWMMRAARQDQSWGLGCFWVRMQAINLSKYILLRGWSPARMLVKCSSDWTSSKNMWAEYKLSCLLRDWDERRSCFELDNISPSPVLRRKGRQWSETRSWLEEGTLSLQYKYDLVFSETVSVV
jgi:hypothetical protein